MNALIESIFADYSIPVIFLVYDGNADTYVTYQETDKDNVLGADDEIINYVDYYDFDIYSKGNYFPIVEEIKKRLTDNGFVWQPSRDSADLYEADTGYYHKTISFAIARGNITQRSV